MSSKQGDELKLLDWVSSPFCTRARLALEEKGLVYESKEEDIFGGKSEELLKANPIHQKVPVLFHNGKPVVESSNIVYYLDEAFPATPLLPTTPYERSQARFWGDYIDEKVFDAGRGIWTSTGEEQEVAKRDFIEVLKNLEEALGDKDFFGGNVFGYVDILAISLTSWFLAYERVGGFKVEDHCPKFSAWIKRCLQRPTVAKVYPDAEKIYHFVLQMQQMSS